MIKNSITTLEENTTSLVETENFYYLYIWYLCVDDS